MNLTPLRGGRDGLPRSPAGVWIILLLSAIPNDLRYEAASILNPGDPTQVLDLLDPEQVGGPRLSHFLGVMSTADVLSGAIFAVSLKLMSIAGFETIVMAALGDDGDGNLDLRETMSLLNRWKPFFAVASAAAKGFLNGGEDALKKLAELVDPFLPGNQGGNASEKTTYFGAVKKLLSVIL